jgi:hypothetical protein
MAGGSAYHQTHGRFVLQGMLLRLLAWVVLGVALVLLAVWLTQRLLG